MKVAFVIGGVRSGKSSFALTEAMKFKGQKAYIATGEALDDEMRERIEKHKKDRGEEWDTIEEPLKIADVVSEIKDQYNLIVLDCLTMWLSNLFMIEQQSSRAAEQQYIMVKQEVEKFLDTLKRYKEPDTTALRDYCSTALFIVSNEVGMGIVPDNALARRFRDLAGYLNQRVAEIADEVYLMISGIPLQVKSKNRVSRLNSSSRSE